MMSLCSAGLLLVAADALGLYVDLSQPAPRRPAGGGLPSHWSHVQGYTLHDFARDFGRDYVPGTSEWAQRERAFRANKEKLIKVLSTPSLTWTPGVTMFMDYQPEEYETLLGLKVDRRARERAGNSSKGNSSVYAQALTQRTYAETPLSANTVHRDLPLSTFIREQGSCGSCWAAAAMSVLEGVAETNPDLLRSMRRKARQMSTPLATLSSEAMVSCTPNLKNCGGTGGCDGATAELGYELVMEKGLPLAAEWPYSAGSVGHPDECEDKHFNTDFRVTISGYKVLPSNQFNPLLEALTQNGHPIAIAVDATNWKHYASGVYVDTDLGPGDFNVNHMVALMGYDKTPNPRTYYLLKNSWGKDFGEQGFIRIEMKAAEWRHCGQDRDAHRGTACLDEPAEAWACGTCGILFDAAYPVEPYVMEERETPSSFDSPGFRGPSYLRPS
mmetsp:Transcript_71489/g.201796  ORF Transcript_71489/g.201796 Transcript_71489/m.201796 type:complete len:443 (-) Transcript_71489:24-1352(-)